MKSTSVLQDFIWDTGVACSPRNRMTSIECNIIDYKPRADHLMPNLKTLKLPLAVGQQTNGRECC